MLRSIIRSFVWLISFLIAIAIGVLIFAFGTPAAESLFGVEWTAMLVWILILPIGCFAGYWVGVRADRLGRRWLSARWPVGTTPASKPGDLSEAGSSDAAGASAPDSIGFSVTNRQRRLIVLSAAIVLLLGPIVIMGNCSGFNEGSMKVANCAVDFPLARGLADLLWGIVLLSAFILGLPVLAYFATCVVLLTQLNRGLRKASEAAAQQSAGPTKAGSGSFS